MDLGSEGNPARSGGHPGGARDAGGRSAGGGDDPAVEMTEELHQIVPARQCDLGAARLDGDDAETGGLAKTPGVDGLGEARRGWGGARRLGLVPLAYVTGRIRFRARNLNDTP